HDLNNGFFLDYENGDDSSLDEALEDALSDSLTGTTSEDKMKTAADLPRQVFIVPLNRRPFFPGMAAPIVIETGSYYEVLKLVPLFKEELQIFLGHSDFTEPGKLADFAVALTTATREELQEVLETFKLEGRIDKALVLLKKELDLSKLQNSINQKIEGTI